MMNEVQPIRDLRKVRDMEDALRQSSERDYIFFRIGINSGLRISDILKLRVGDVRDKDYFTLRMQKTNKAIRIKVQNTLLAEIAEYVAGKADDEYLFKSKKGKNNPIQRAQAWRVLRAAARKVGIEDEIGTHSMRKTFGYHMYNHTDKDVTMVQKFLGHTSPQHTLRYIGIVQDDMDEVMDGFDVFG